DAVGREGQQRPRAVGRQGTSGGQCEFEVAPAEAGRGPDPDRRLSPGEHRVAAFGGQGGQPGGQCGAGGGGLALHGCDDLADAERGGLASSAGSASAPARPLNSTETVAGGRTLGDRAARIAPSRRGSTETPHFSSTGPGSAGGTVFRGPEATTAGSSPMTSDT